MRRRAGGGFGRAGEGEPIYWVAPVEERKQLVIENRSNLYAAQMNLAFQAAEQPGGIECVSNLTSQWLPENVGVDRRGWEGSTWNRDATARASC